MENPLYELPKGCDFNAVGNNSSLKSECSPKLNDQFPKSNFQGILINSALEIVWPKNSSPADMEVMPNGNVEGPLKFMIAGLINIPYGTLNLQGNFSYEVLIVAVDQQTAKAFSGKLIRFGFAGARPDVFGSDESQNSIDTLTYFNVDLIQNLEIPVVNATYTVYATLGEFKSNVLTVKTKVE